MSRYYAIERSDEYLMHYGIVGMRWGVRRALKNKDAKSLEKHYNKAIKKLTELSLLSNKKVHHDYSNSLRSAQNGVMETDAVNKGKMGSLVSKADDWMANKNHKKLDKWAKAINDTFDKTSYGGNKSKNQRSKITALANQSDVRAYAKKQKDAKTRNYMTTGINDLYRKIDVNQSLGRASIVDQAYVRIKKKKKT